MTKKQLKKDFRYRDKLPELFFYVGLSVELLIVLIDKSELHNPIEGRLFQLTFSLFLLKLLFTKYSLKEWLCMFGLGLLGVISYYVTGRNEILRIVVFVCCMRDIDIKRAMRYVFRVTLIGVVVIVLLSCVGIGRIVPEQDFRTAHEGVRYSFGMGHPNALHCMYLMLVLLFIYLHASSLKVWMLIALFAGNLFIYLFTDSRTGLLIATLAILLACLMEKSKKLKKAGWPYYLGMLTFLGAIGISVLGAKYSQLIWYEEKLKRLDELLSGRFLTLYYDTTVHEGILETWRLFSSPESMRAFDAGWIRMFYWYGIIPGIIFCLLLLLLLRHCRKTGNYMGLVMIVVLALYTIVEAHIVSVYLARNYLLFLFAGMFAEIGMQDQREYWFRCYRLWPGNGKVVKHAAEE